MTTRAGLPGPLTPNRGHISQTGMLGRAHPHGTPAGASEAGLAERGWVAQLPRRQGRSCGCHPTAGPDLKPTPVGAGGAAEPWPKTGFT